MKNIIVSGLMATIWLLSLRSLPAADAPLSPTQWKSLFNGKDLSGWSVKCHAADMDKSFWRVDQGTILCDTGTRKNHDYVWLETDQEFGDFELDLKFQTYKETTGNSGVQFRSRYDDKANGGRMNGPQVDIHPPPAVSWHTGLIVDETFEEQRWISPSLKNFKITEQFRPEHTIFKYAEDGDGWNDLQLICRGTQVKVIVNGIVRTDWDGAGVLDNAAHAAHGVGMRGHLALQLHKNDLLCIRFKDIQIKEL